MNQLCFHVLLNLVILIDANSWIMYSSMYLQDVCALRMDTSRAYPGYISNMFLFHIL